jgi:hypothetical protein
MKISKREKIILIVVLLVVIYGVYALFIAPSSDKAILSPADTSKKLAVIDFEKLESEVASVTKEKVDLYTVARIGDKNLWFSDPFYKGVMAAHAGDQISFVYTGYLELGNKRYAVINGLDYGWGEELEIGGYFVKGINPYKVIIEDKSGQLRIEVPFLEE